MFSHRNLSSTLSFSQGIYSLSFPGNGASFLALIMYPGCKGKSQGNNKTTLERNWFFFQRGISQYRFNKTRYKPTFKYLYRWLKQHITIGKWSHIYTKISQRHIHEIYQRQDNHFITVIHLVQVKQKR